MEAEYFTVKNWHRYQHYSHRTPPWVKLYYEILSSEDWVMLPDPSRVLMICCILIASRNSGRVPNNPTYIARLCHLKKVDFKPLIRVGFLDASMALALDASKLHTNATPDKEVDLRLDLDKKTLCSEPGNGTGSKRIEWDGKFQGITPEDMTLWGKAYPAVNIPQQLYAMDQWLLANPAKRKKKYRLFITNWLSRKQERVR